MSPVPVPEVDLRDRHGPSGWWRPMGLVGALAELHRAMDNAEAGDQADRRLVESFELDEFASWAAELAGGNIVQQTYLRCTMADMHVLQRRYRQAR